MMKITLLILGSIFLVLTIATMAVYMLQSTIIVLKLIGFIIFLAVLVMIGCLVRVILETIFG